MDQPLHKVPERRRSSRFDKVFPVYLTSESGICRGIARNISSGGMFIEAREPNALGARVTISFADEGTGIEMSVVAEVRYHVAIEHGSEKGRSTLRGMGVRFLRFHARDDRLFLPPGTATLH
jgi:hypothetical protein